MCGRFTLTAPAKQIESLFSVTLSDALEPRFNIAPGQSVLGVYQDHEGQRQAGMMRWGLIPFWAKDASFGSRCINARAETIHEKASFREPIRRRRCLIPASGFYEWRHEGKKKFPHYFHFMEDLGAFAGVWDVWRGGDTPIVSCSIITTTANSLVEPFHDRMPVVLTQPHFQAWLNPENPFSVVRGLLVPSNPDVFEAWEVGTRVNIATHEGADLIEPVSDGP